MVTIGCAFTLFPHVVGFHILDLKNEDPDRDVLLIWVKTPSLVCVCGLLCLSLFEFVGLRP